MAVSLGPTHVSGTLLLPWGAPHTAHVPLGGQRQIWLCNAHTVPSLDSLQSTHFCACWGLTPGLAMQKAQKLGPQASTVASLAVTFGNLTGRRHLSGHTAPPRRKKSALRGQPGWLGPPFRPSAGARSCLGSRTKADCPPHPLCQELGMRTCQGQSRQREDVGRGGLTQMAGLLLSASVPSRGRSSCSCA